MPVSGPEFLAGQRARSRPVSPPDIAHTRVFRSDTGQLVAGVGMPIPDDVPEDLLVFEGQEQVEVTPPPDEPKPRTLKTGRGRTRVKPAAENR